MLVSMVNELFHFYSQLFTGEDALESGKEYVHESRKQATKKAKETAEETSEAAAKAKRNVEF